MTAKTSSVATDGVERGGDERGEGRKRKNATREEENTRTN
jgi:hypothetical protein